MLQRGGIGMLLDFRTGQEEPAATVVQGIEPALTFEQLPDFIPATPFARGGRGQEYRSRRSAGWVVERRRKQPSCLPGPAARERLAGLSQGRVENVANVTGIRRN